MCTCISGLMLPGCGATDFGGELAATPRPRVLATSAAATTLRLPADEKFSIVFAPSKRAPGLGGEADAQASASSDGEAEVKVRVARSGTASGVFQLGHALKNESGVQLDLSIRVQARFEYDARATPASGRKDASVALRLFARDQRNRQLRNLDLLIHGVDQGDARSTVQKELTFPLTLGPGDSASIFLAGQAEATTETAAQAWAHLKISELQMEMTATPAPAVAPADAKR